MPLFIAVSQSLLAAANLATAAAVAAMDFADEDAPAAAEAAPVFVNGRGPFRFIIDTGASGSAMAPKVSAALELERLAEDPTRATRVFGATQHTADGSPIPAARIYLGEVKVANVRATFGDFDVFRLWGLESGPAILLGMNVLGVVDALMIDYRRYELRFRLPGSSDSNNIELRGPPFGRLRRGVRRVEVGLRTREHSWPTPAPVLGASRRTSRAPRGSRAMEPGFAACAERQLPGNGRAVPIKVRPLSNAKAGPLQAR